MTLTPMDLRELTGLAVLAATEAGQMIAQSHPGEVEYKSSGYSPASQVVTDIDRHSEQIIVDHLAPTLDRFGLGLLTEERDDDGGRRTASHFWCIDPLDGTLPFIEEVPGYAVSIALVGQAGDPIIGVVYDPVESTVFHAVKGGGIFCNHRRWTADSSPEVNKLSVFADRSLLSGDNSHQLLSGLNRIAAEAGLDGTQIHNAAGAVMNACGVLTNGPACYFKFPMPSGGGSLWDFAATACLFGETEAPATDFYGDALELNRVGSTAMNHRGVLFVTDNQLAERIRTLGPGPA